jgi:hypothetical protein
MKRLRRSRIVAAVLLLAVSVISTSSFALPENVELAPDGSASLVGGCSPGGNCERPPRERI